MNNWYIDRSKNIINDSLDETLKLLYEYKNDTKTDDLIKVVKNSGSLGNAIGNPNAALTRFRDHGFLSQNNSVSDSVVDYVEGRLNKSELIIDLLLKRPASKENSPNIKPFCIICKVFNIMFETNTDIDDIFITFYECKEYLMPINSYDDITYELVESIICERNYSIGKKFPNPRITLESNEDTNLSIWFNALKTTPLFMPLESDSKRILIPNLKQMDFFKFVSINADELDETPTQSNKCLYDYYCKRETGLLEVIPKVVIKTSIDITDNQTGKYLFEYLFGFKKIKDFNYSKFLKYDCFGIFFPFITVPRLAIRQIYLTNQVIGNVLYDFIENNNGTYTSLFEDGKFEYTKTKLKDYSDSKSGRLQTGHNILLYGVPGVGKSHMIKNEYCDDESYMERTVFHPDYTYLDFVGQIMPQNVDGKISYPFIPGPFTRIMKKAWEDKGNSYYLIIEEINRGNAPAIFGEIFQLLDRKDNGQSEYGINNLDIAKEVYGDEQHLVKIPSNLSLLATMNTADQNVFTIDTAFKRRWEMKCIKNDIKNSKQAGINICGRNTTWGSFAVKINEKIIDLGEGNLSSEDNRLGSYFASKKELNNSQLFAEKVLMYLWNDAFKYDRDKVFKNEYKTLEQLIDGFETKAFDVFVDSFEFDNTLVSNEILEQDYTDNSNESEISIEDYYQGKSVQMTTLCKQVISDLKGNVEDMITGATANYIALKLPGNNRPKNVVEIHIKKDKITFNIKEPSNPEHKIGQLLPDNYRWSLNYQIDISDESELDKIVNVLQDSFANMR
ncbi:MAG: AAA family ATPase [Clostridia bacterium]|nr:AAA family ATPase [Clostridia bacterium]